MDKIVIIGDGLVPSALFKKALNDNWPTSEYSIKMFSWYENFSKSEFQKKISKIEKNGPYEYEPSNEMLDALKKCDYLFVHIAPINEAMIDACENVKLIGLARGGTENIDLEACKNKGIPVIRAVKNTEATSEFTLALILAQTRNIGIAMQQLYNGTWNKQFYNDGNRYSLNEYTVGIVGLGNIGQSLARKLISLGINVIAYHPNLSEEKINEINLPIKYVDKENILSKSDILSLHLRLNDQTVNFLDSEEFKKMKEDSILINTARAGLVSEDALEYALENNLIGGCALDVFWDEPIKSDHYLFKYSNVTLTPHIAGDTDVIKRAPEILLKEVVKWFNGEETSMLIKEKYMVNN